MYLQSAVSRSYGNYKPKIYNRYTHTPLVAQKVKSLLAMWETCLGWEDPLRREWLLTPVWRSFPGDSDGKESARNLGDLGLITGLGRSHGVGNGNPLQYACLETSVDRGAWRAAVHGVAKSWT